MTPPPAPIKFAAIEGLRGWMAWWVVLGHAVEVTGIGGRLPPLLSKLLSSSYMAVQVFMIVSGFVIAHVLLTTRETYATYIARRWFRLMPLLLVLLAIAVLTRDLYAVAWIDNPWAGGAERLDRMQAETALWPAHLALHLLLLHGVVPESLLPYASTTFLAPAWSLSLEWQFYLVAPLLIASMLSARRVWFAAALIGLSLPTLLGGFGTWQGSQPFLLQNLPFFLVGIASRHVLERRLSAPPLACCAGSVLVFIAGRGVGQIVHLVPVAVLWAWFLLLSAREAGRSSWRSPWLDRFTWLVADNRLAAALGRLSYATYLCHVPVFTLVIGLGMLVSGRSDQSLVIVLTLAALPVTLATSQLLNVAVEQPGIRAGKRLLSAMRGARVPLPQAR